MIYLIYIFFMFSTNHRVFRYFDTPDSFLEIPTLSNQINKEAYYKRPNKKSKRFEY